MGAVDLVLQVESPKSVTRGLQRIGRAGHSVGDTSKGRIFPKFRADLLECAVVAQRMREGVIETTVVPRNPLDVLAQQIVAMAASADDEDRRCTSTTLHALVARTYSYAELSRAQLENVLDMLDGRYPSRGVRRAAPAHRLGPRRGHAPRAQGLARAGDHQRGHDPRPRPVLASTCPTAAASASSTRRWSTRRGPGQTFLLGASSLADRGDHPRPRDRHARAGRPGRGAVLARRLASGARRSSARRSARSRAGRSSRTPRRSRRDYDLDELAAQQPARLPARAAGGHARRPERPHDRRRALPRRDRRLARCASSRPFGGRVHAAWGLALCARIRDEYGLESDAIWSDDGIIVHLPDADEPPGAELVLIDPDELEDLVVGELGGSALFGARFRENAGRALLIPRAYPGRRTPLWQQRLKSQTLLEVAKRYAQFPIVLETYRECLRDVLDVPGPAGPAAQAALARARAGRGRDADRLAVRLLAAVRLRRDLHVRGRHAQRRAARRRAGARPRAAARAARPGGAARADRPRRARAGRGRPAAARPSARARTPSTRCTTCCAGSATSRSTRPAPARAARAPTPRPGSSSSPASGARCALRVGGEQRWIAAEDAGLLPRRARRRPAVAACPRCSSPTCPTRWSGSCAAARAPTARSRPRSCAARYGLDLTPVLAGARARGRARARRAAPRRHAARVVRPRGAAPAAARLAGRAAQGDRAGRPARARALPARLAGRRPPPARRRGHRPAARGARPAAGARAARRRVGARRAAAAHRRLLAGLAGPAVRRRARSSGSAPARSAAAPAGSRCTSARTSRCSARRRAARRERPAERASTRRSASGCARARASSPTCSSTSPASRPRSSRRRCGTSCGRAR